MSISALVMATTITSLLSSVDVPRNAIALYICIVRLWLLNLPDAIGATSAANADTAQVASIVTARKIFIGDLLSRGERSA